MFRSESLSLNGGDHPRLTDHRSNGAIYIGRKLRSIEKRIVISDNRKSSESLQVNTNRAFDASFAASRRSSDRDAFALRRISNERAKYSNAHYSDQLVVK